MGLPTLEPASLGLIDPSISAILVDLMLSVEESAGPRFYDELAAADLELQAFPGAGPARAALAAGEIAAVSPTSVGQVLLLQSEGAPVDFEVYDSPWATLIHQATLVDSPHPNAAQVYMDWFLSADGGQRVVAETGLGPVLPSVPPLYDQPDTPVRLARDLPQDEVDAFLKRWSELFG